MKFRKKPVVIDAIQYTDHERDERALENFIGRDLTWKTSAPPKLVIQTLEGEMLASVGDWIIRGMKGELYPCKPDIFEMTYEADVGVRCNCPMCEHHESAREHGAPI